MTEHSRSVERGVGTAQGIATRPETSRGSSMRSPLGFPGAIVLLLALPAAVLTQVLFGSGSETTIHFALALGSTLVAFSVFAFNTPKWIAWIGFGSMSGLAAIFLVQGASQLIGSGSLTYFTYQVLGNWPERVLIDLALLWLVGLLLTDSQGRTRVLGIVAMAIVVCVEVYGIGLTLLGTSLFSEVPGWTKLLYLLPFVWLLFESRKRQPKTGS
jgi:hypothetical protein